MAALCPGRDPPSGRWVAATRHRSPSGSTYGILSRNDQVTCDAVHARMQTIAVSPKSRVLNVVDEANLTTKKIRIRIFAMYVVIAVIIMACGLTLAAQPSARPRRRS
jgi:hypothetical protein